MLGRKRTCFRNVERRSESNGATRWARLRHGLAHRALTRVVNRPSTSPEAFRRRIATLTLVMSPTLVAVLSGAAIAAPNEQAGAWALEGTHVHEGGAVRPPAAPAGNRDALTTSILPTCGHMAPTTHVMLNASFQLAVRSVREVPACRALFQGLGTSGEEKLAHTIYERAGPRDIEFCLRRHATAFTRVGISTTWICPAFDHLVSADGALTLIHEALHFAGLPEFPGTPGAPTAEQIQRMVRARCHPTRGRRHPALVEPPKPHPLSRVFDPVLDRQHTPAPGCGFSTQTARFGLRVER